MNRLAEPISRLYAVFSRYPVPVHHACPCCVTEADRRGLTGAPLRELTPDALGRYAFKALTTWGTVDGFKHYLPRLLELSVGPGGLTPGVVFGKLGYAKWTGWRSAEQEALRTFLREVWALALATPPTVRDAGECLEDIARAEPELGPYLQRWDEEGSRLASLHLAELILRHAEALRRPGVVLPGTWPARPWAQVEAWLLGPGPGERLERALFEAGDDGHAEALLGEAEGALARARRERPADRISGPGSRDAITKEP